MTADVTYGVTFPSIVVHDNIWGTQFHPEKSGDDGLALVHAFVSTVAHALPATRPAVRASA